MAIEQRNDSDKGGRIRPDMVGGGESPSSAPCVASPPASMTATKTIALSC
jgi:hypothetical protein